MQCLYYDACDDCQSSLMICCEMWGVLCCSNKDEGVGRWGGGLVCFLKPYDDVVETHGAHQFVKLCGGLLLGAA